MAEDDKPKPTIDELEAILNNPNPGEVTINMDGSITVKRTKPKLAVSNPAPLTKHHYLGDEY